MKYVVDKIEGDLAVLENIIDGNIINVPIDKLPNIKSIHLCKLFVTYFDSNAIELILINYSGVFAHGGNVTSPTEPDWYIPAPIIDVFIMYISITELVIVFLLN